MILYIHGFASSSKSKKVTLLHNSFKDVVAINLSYEPDLAVKKLEEFMEEHRKKNITLIGSSLGGFYSIYLADKYDLKSVLINPSIHPEKTLKRYVGQEIQSYSTNESFFFKKEYIEQLKKYKTITYQGKNSLLLLQKGDKTLDYTEALSFLPEAKSVVESGGSHQFDDFDNYFLMIKKFIDEG